MARSLQGFGRMSGPTQLARGRLAGLENIAQTIGTMGPTATLGTILPLLMAKAGNASWLLTLGILVIFVAILACITVFAGIRTSAGSLGTYARMGLGRWPGNLAGWSYAIAMTFVSCSSAVSSAYYLSLVAAHFSHAALGTGASLLLVVLMVGLAWWPAYRDVRFSARLMLAAEAISVAAIVAILALAMVRNGHLVDSAQLRLEGADFGHVRTGFVLAFMVLAGFEGATALAEESKEATKVLPKVMFGCLLPTGLLFVAGIYCLGVLAHTHALALDQTNAPFDVIAQSVGLPALGWMSSLGVALSCFGCALGGFNAGSRVLYSMARSRQLSRRLQAIHPVNGTPHRALVVLGLISILVPMGLLLRGVALDDLMDYLMQIASFGFLGAYFLVCLAAPLFLARRKRLGLVAAAGSVVALAAIGATWILSLVPIQDPPYRYLPFVFAALLLGGVIASIRAGRRRGRSPAGENDSKTELVVTRAG